MKTFRPNQFQRGRRLIINPWFEEHAGVTVQVQPPATDAHGMSDLSKWEGWPSLLIRGELSAHKPSADETR